MSEPQGTSDGRQSGSAGAPARASSARSLRSESVGAVRSTLVAFARTCELAERTVDAVALAATEAATNVVLHAYAEAEEPGQIEVTAALAGVASCG